MLRVVEVRKAGEWSPPAADTVVLPYDARNRRRRALKSERGLPFLLDRAEATVLRDGDGLVLQDGRIIGVKPASERLLEITADGPRLLMRLAWHLGNRHLPTEIHEHRLVIREDHVIADMVTALGGRVRAVEAPFNPEGGAYAHGH